MYGRLKAEGREDLAVKAHGYLLLSPEQEIEVTKLIAGPKYTPLDPEEEFDADAIWDRCDEHQGEPIRAIVKDLAMEDEAFELAQIPSIWNDLKQLHSLGILVRDIHSGNYLGGKLVDFSLAWTMYHPCLAHISQSWISQFRREEAHKLEVMFDNEYPFDEFDVPQDLQACAGNHNRCPTDPRNYQWLKKVDGKEVEKHVREELYADAKAGK